MVAMICYNPLVFGLLVVFLALGYGYFLLTAQNSSHAIEANRARAELKAS